MLRPSRSLRISTVLLKLTALPALLMKLFKSTQEMDVNVSPAPLMGHQPGNVPIIKSWLQKAFKEQMLWFSTCVEIHVRNVLIQ